MGKQQPALLGGLFIGVLSALPAISMGNCCCCLWVVTGGVLATYLLQGRTEGPIQTSDALVTGLLAGLIGGVVAGILNLALAPIIGPFQQRILASLLERVRDMPNVPPESRAQLDELIRQQPGDVPLVIRLGHSALFIGVSAVMAMLGALLGVAFFRKKTPAPPVQG